MALFRNPDFALIGKTEPKAAFITWLMQWGQASLSAAAALAAPLLATER